MTCTEGYVIWDNTCVAYLTLELQKLYIYSTKDCTELIKSVYLSPNALTSIDILRDEALISNTVRISRVDDDDIYFSCSSSAECFEWKQGIEEPARNMRISSSSDDSDRLSNILADALRDRPASKVFGYDAPRERSRKYRYVRPNKMMVFQQHSLS